MGSAQGPVASELEQARAASQFGAHTPLPEKLLAVAIRAQNFTGSTGVAVALMEGQEIVCRANWGTSAPEVGAQLSLEHSFTGLCVRTGQPLRCDDAQSDPRVNPEACRALGISAIAAAPIRRELKVVGVIAAFSDTPNAFTDKHLLILTTLAEVVAELLEDPRPVEPLPEAKPATGASCSAAVPRPPSATLEDLAAVFETEPLAAPISAIADAAPTTARPSAQAPLQPHQAESLSERSKVGSTSTGPSGLAVVKSVAAAAATPSKAPPADTLSDLFEAPSAKSAPQPRTVARTVPVSQRDRISMDAAAADTLTFAGLETDASARPGWLLPAAALVVLAIVAFAGWRWHEARVTGLAKQGATATTPALEPQPSPAAQSDSQQVKPSAAVAEVKGTPFSSPPMIKAASSRPKAVRDPEPPEDVTIRQIPQPVVEAEGPVRQPAAQVPEAQAPQLALSTSDLPSALAKPTPSTVAPPVSRVTVAQLVRRVEPKYPEAARHMGLSGKVVVRASISKTGTVSNVQWVSGNEIFRYAIVTAVKQWRYTPASLDGQPIDSDLEIALQFNRPTSP